MLDIPKKSRREREAKESGGTQGVWGADEFLSSGCSTAKEDVEKTEVLRQENKASAIGCIM